ncbi:TRAP transporter substrate-binding protein [Oceanispirochaeta crateris]|nr:TRAP transporter substrate-binding protein [Oceanispirochaeta crateris]
MTFKMKSIRLTVLMLLIASFFLLSVSAFANGQQDSAAPANGEKKVMKINAASMFDEVHPFTQTYYKFEELVNKYQDEVTIEVKYNLNKSLGIETDYFRFMSQGESVDLAILAPANIATRVPSIAIVDMPLLFKDYAHRNRVLASDLFKAIEEDVVKKANVRIIGYAGGASRSIISNYPITNMEDLQGFKLRVQGAPIWAKVFDAVGAVPSVIAYDEVYSAIQTGVIQGLENEKIGYAQMRFFEVAPHYTLNEHSITVRPLFMSEKAYNKFSPTVQAAIMKAGKEAGEFGAQVELELGQIELDKLVKSGLANVHPFSDADKAEFKARATPALLKYVEEAGFTELYNGIQAIK